MKGLEDKYISLLLTRCLNFKNSKSLFIQCDLKEHLEFAKKVKAVAIDMGIIDVSILVNDLDDIHNYLKSTDLDNITLNPLIDRSDLEKYALKGAAILFFNSPVPGIMSDISNDKIRKMHEEIEKTIPYYRKSVSHYIFPWCIAALPNERWAKSVFGDTEDAYQRLYLYILQMCMIDKKDPALAWDNFIKNSNIIKNKLDELKIREMHYRNFLGTDLFVGLPEQVRWLNQDKGTQFGKMIVNMPSYEIFTTPDWRKTEGIVYSSRPLFYSGSLIEEFWLEFHKGKVINCGAKKGLNTLKQMLTETENADYLGEVALVPYDSPISNTGLVFNNILFDENASCHLALGRGFPKCIPNNTCLSVEELQNLGVNYSLLHVDFMIGTCDLEIEAETPYGRKLIFKDGNFNL